MKNGNNAHAEVVRTDIPAGRTTATSAVSVGISSWETSNAHQSEYLSSVPPVTDLSLAQPSGPAAASASTPIDNAGPAGAGRQQNERKQSQWSDALIRTTAQLRNSGAKIIGITGLREGVGVTRIVYQLLENYHSVGLKGAVIDARSAVATGAQSDGESARPSPSAGNFSAALFAALEHADVVIVDLPPVLNDSAESQPDYFLAAKQCETVLLVCLTGRTPARDLTRGLEASKAAGVTIGGILLNDYHIPLSRRLSG